MKDIIETIRNSGKFDKFLKLIELTGHIDTLRNCCSFTMLVPTDEAMEKLEREYPMNREYKDYFLKVLKRHVIKGRHNYNDLKESGRSIAMDGTEIRFDRKRDLINGRMGIVAKNLICKNGLIHGVNGVMTN